MKASYLLYRHTPLLLSRPLPALLNKTCASLPQQLGLTSCTATGQTFSCHSHQHRGLGTITQQLLRPVLCTALRFPCYSLQCRGLDISRTNFCTSHLTMFAVDDYVKHNVQCLKDIQCDGTCDPMDVIVAGQRHEAKEHIIFFGGDVQDYPQNMMSHRDNGKYVRWNSLSTAGRLCERFPNAMVLVFKPHHMHLKTFSVYSQFVESNDFGAPTHSPDFGAWRSLVKVYRRAVGMAMTSPQSTGGENVSQSGTSSDNRPAAGDITDVSKQSSTSIDCATTTITKLPVHIIGFSKGCIVLNQLVHELKSVQSNDTVQSFVAQLQAMTWLDGGHSGGSNTWVTDQSTLGLLADLGLDICVHVTPYQVKDPMRRWIGKEKRRFVDFLQKAGAKVTDKLHFEDEPRSIENHFRVLEEF